VVHGAEVLLPPVVEQLVVHGVAMGPPLVVEQPMGVKEEPEVCFLLHSCFNCKQDCEHAPWTWKTLQTCGWRICYVQARRHCSSRVRFAPTLVHSCYGCVVSCCCYCCSTPAANGTMERYTRSNRKDGGSPFQQLNNQKAVVTIRSNRSRYVTIHSSFFRCMDQHHVVASHTQPI
jgi:hypothetical protein